MDDDSLVLNYNFKIVIFHFMALWGDDRLAAAYRDLIGEAVPVIDSNAANKIGNWYTTGYYYHRFLC